MIRSPHGEISRRMKWPTRKNMLACWSQVIIVTNTLGYSIYLFVLAVCLLAKQDRDLQLFLKHLNFVFVANNSLFEHLAPSAHTAQVPFLTDVSQQPAKLLWLLSVTSNDDQLLLFESATLQKNRCCKKIRDIFAFRHGCIDFYSTVTNMNCFMFDFKASSQCFVNDSLYSRDMSHA